MGRLNNNRQLLPFLAGSPLRRGIWKKLTTKGEIIVKKKIFDDIIEAEFTANELLGWDDVEVVEIDSIYEDSVYVIRAGRGYLRENGYVA